MTARRLAKVVALLAMIALWRAAAAAPQAVLEGAWIGHWVRDGAQLEVTMRFLKSGDGYRGSFDAEALRATGIPMQRIEWNPPEVTWQVAGDESTMQFTARLRGHAIEGRFADGDARGTFSLVREPRPPAIPRREEIAFKSGEVVLSGTIFVPEGSGLHPGIVFLHGSGAEGRWASSFLAERFSRAGFAALTFDKRGVGHSGGDWKGADFEDLARDAAAAVSALSTRPYVEPTQVGIHGHSQGGTIAPLSARRIGNPAFVIASAASGVAMRDLEIFSLENSLAIPGMSPGDAASAREFVRALVATAYDGASWEQLDEAVRRVSGKPWAFELPPKADYYWAFSRRTAGYDALSYWREVAAPALLVYGERDERTPVRESAARISRAYLEGRGVSLKVVIFAGADHGFRIPAAPGQAFAWPRTVPGYPDAIIRWALEAVSARK